MPLRIDHAVDPLRCGHRKAHRHRFARCRRQAMLGRFAMQVRAIGISDDQAGVLRKNFARQILREGEEQEVEPPVPPKPQPVSTPGPAPQPVAAEADGRISAYRITDPRLFILSATFMRPSVQTDSRHGRTFAAENVSGRAQRGAGRESRPMYARRSFMK